MSLLNHRVNIPLQLIKTFIMSKSRSKMFKSNSIKNPWMKFLMTLLNIFINSINSNSIIKLHLNTFPHSIQRHFNFVRQNQCDNKINGNALKLSSSKLSNWHFVPCQNFLQPQVLRKCVSHSTKILTHLPYLFREIIACRERSFMRWRRC